MIRAFLTAIHAAVTGGRLLPDQPHRYAADRSWPGCWCGMGDAAPVHGGRAGR